MSGYCPECNSCGESGCCPPTQCKTVQGIYCEHALQEYHRNEEKNNLWFDCLRALGVDDPFSLTVDAAKGLGSITPKGKKKTVSGLIRAALPKHDDDDTPSD